MLLSHHLNCFRHFEAPDRTFNFMWMLVNLCVGVHVTVYVWSTLRRKVWQKLLISASTCTLCTHTQLTHTRDGINNGRVSCLWSNRICHVRILVQSNISWNFFGNCTSRKLKIYVNWLQNTWVLSNNYLVIYQQTAHRLNNLSSMIYNQHSCFCPLCLSASVFVMTVCLSFPFSADHFQLHMVREFKCSIYLCL